MYNSDLTNPSPIYIKRYITSYVITTRKPHYAFAESLMTEYKKLPLDPNTVDSLVKR
jgi:hypothetical protein